MKQRQKSPNKILQPTAKSAADFCYGSAFTTVLVSSCAFLAAAEQNVMSYGINYLFPRYVAPHHSGENSGYLVRGRFIHVYCLCLFTDISNSNKILAFRARRTSRAPTNLVLFKIPCVNLITRRYSRAKCPLHAHLADECTTQ